MYSFLPRYLWSLSIFEVVTLNFPLLTSSYLPKVTLYKLEIFSYLSHSHLDAGCIVEYNWIHHQILVLTIYFLSKLFIFIYFYINHPSFLAFYLYFVLIKCLKFFLTISWNRRVFVIHIPSKGEISNVPGAYRSMEF